jgi:hypothetical protein
MLKRLTLVGPTGLILCFASAALAQTPPVSVGAGVQTSFDHTSPDVGTSTDAFVLNSVRLYVSGTAAPKTKFMFNTEYDGLGAGRLVVLDAAAQFEISPQLNIWAGRFLPPSDRANMYGPYYAHHWYTFQDGVQDGYPFVGTPGQGGAGRDNGIMYWGQFDKVKVSAGAFDGGSATSSKTVIGAGRVQVDFWDPEGGYYLNGTYYGKKNLLAVGIAGQVQGSDNTAWSADFLLDKKAGDGAFSIESEFASYNKLGGYNGRYQKDQGGYGLASYLFPPAMGMTGNFEILAKYAYAEFTKGLTVLDKDYNQKTTELNFNYVIKEFNARIMVFYVDTRFSAIKTNSKQFGVGFQLQI